MTAHTPKPWIIEAEPYEGNPDFVAISGDKWGALAAVVVQTDSGPSAEGRANARLIAAAPDLLAACQHAAASEHHPACGYIKRHLAIAVLCDCHVKKASAAIAKAKGGA